MNAILDRRPGQPFLFLWDFFPMQSQGFQEPANTTYKTDKGLQGFGRSVPLCMSDNPSLLPLIVSSLCPLGSLEQ